MREKVMRSGAAAVSAAGWSIESYFRRLLDAAEKIVRKEKHSKTKKGNEKKGERRRKEAKKERKERNDFLPCYCEHQEIL